MRALQLIAPVALIAALGGFGLQSAQADGPRGYGNFGPPSRSQGFYDGFRPGFPHRHGHYRDDFYRHRNPYWYGHDYYRHRGHHHHHHHHDRFDRFPRFPYRGQF